MCASSFLESNPKKEDRYKVTKMSLTRETYAHVFFQASAKNNIPKKTNISLS